MPEINMNNYENTDNRRLTEGESRIIGFLQVASILSVITAHVVNKSTVSTSQEIITSLLSAFGCVGVVLFFILGGFLYNRKKGDSFTYWRKKIFSLIIPWIFCSVITYLIKVITTHQFDVLDYLKWLLGYGTWYYYSTVYIVCLVIFKFLSKKDIFLWLAIASSIISLVMLTVNRDLLLIPYLTSYLNIFNWIGFFAIGVLIRKYRVDKVLLSSNWFLILSVLFTLVTFLLMYLFNVLGYFSIIGMLFELSFALLLLFVAKMACQYRFGKIVSKFGIYAYSIYLLHMPIVQPICSRLPRLLVVEVFKPLLGLVIMMILVFVGHRICGILPFGNYVCRLFGIREHYSNNLSKK